MMSRVAWLTLLVLALAPVPGAAQAGDPLGRPANRPLGVPAQSPTQPAGMEAGGDGLAGAVARFEQALARDVARDSVGSMAAAVVANGELVWQGAWGWADRDRRRLATPATLYRIGSISKTLTAVVLQRLVEQGVLDLDQPVTDHLPELRRLANLSPDHPPITYRHLASHTAGLAREPSTSHAARGPFLQWKRKLVAVLPVTEVVGPAGSGYRYSNIGYGALGLALERAAGRPYERLVQELVFDPLGMTGTTLRVGSRDQDRLATGYVNPTPDSVDPRVPRAEHRGRGYKVPNGGVYSTVGDLARLIPALSQPVDDARRLGSVERLMAEPLREAMLEDQTHARDVPADGDAGPGEDQVHRRTGYGLGLQLQRVGETVWAGHSGSVAGYAAYLLFDPETATGVVLLRNYNRGETNLGAAAARLMLELGPRGPAGRSAPAQPARPQ